MVGRIFAALIISLGIGIGLAFQPLQSLADSLCYSPNTSTWPGLNLPALSLTYPLCTAAGAISTTGSGGGGGGNVNVTNFPATQAVSGSVSVNNFPATQPVSVATTIPVSGTFYQTTQPVSLATTLPVAVQGTVPVSGTFYQATQPVSLATLPPLSAGSAVFGSIGNTAFGISGSLPSGTNALGSVSISNFPGTQPVSGSVSVSNFPATQPVSVATTLPVSGTFYQTTQPVSIATALPAGANTIGNVGALGTGGEIITDANGVQSHKVCDATTSTQCAAVDTSGGTRLSTTATTGLLASAATSGYFHLTNGSSNMSVGSVSADGTAAVTGGYVNSQNVAYNGTNWDRIRKSSFANGPLWTTQGGSLTYAFAAATTASTTVAAHPSILVQFLVTSAGTASVTCYDNASASTGTIIGITPASTSVGQIYRLEVPAANGITCQGATGSPALTISEY